MHFELPQSPYVTTLTLGSRLRQGFAKVQANNEIG